MTLNREDWAGAEADTREEGPWDYFTDEAHREQPGPSKTHTGAQRPTELCISVLHRHLAASATLHFHTFPHPAFLKPPPGGLGCGQPLPTGGSGPAPRMKSANGVTLHVPPEHRPQALRPGWEAVEKSVP